MDIQVPKDILSAYDLVVNDINVISSGLIHETYRIQSGVGDFVLQRLHPKLASDEIAEDFANVTTYLAKNNFLAPQLMRTKDGEVLATDKDGHRWRMQTFIEGETHEVVGKEMVKSAGKMYARFHRVMTGFSHEFKSQRSLHDTKSVHTSFLKTIDQFHGSDLYPPVQDMCEVIRKVLPKLFLPKDLPRHVIHGDPKISNVRFRNGEAVALLDLDTCTRHTVLVELGDAFRSWCGLAEDNPENEFRLNVFKAGLQGYKQEVGDILSKREMQLIPQAVQLITLELTARFLQDYFLDEYFGWDAGRYKDRTSHNLARAKGQFSLYQDVKRKTPDISDML